MNKEITAYEVHQLFEYFYDGDFVLNPGDMAKFDEIAKRITEWMKNESKIII